MRLTRVHNHNIFNQENQDFEKKSGLFQDQIVHLVLIRTKSWIQDLIASRGEVAVGILFFLVINSVIQFFIPVSQSQDFSTTEHPFVSLSHNMFCSVRNLYEEAPRGEDFTHHHIQEVSHTLAFHLIHPFHLGQGSLPHHLWPQPSEIYLISISGNNCVCTFALHFHNFLQHIYQAANYIQLIRVTFILPQSTSLFKIIISN